MIDTHQPDLVVLAGFMRILGARFVQRYEGRMLNIHPSLLPAFPGLHTHQRALQAGCKLAGATVHFVGRPRVIGDLHARGLRLTDRSWPVLKGVQPVRLRKDELPQKTAASARRRSA